MILNIPSSSSTDFERPQPPPVGATCNFYPYLAPLPTDLHAGVAVQELVRAGNGVRGMWYRAETHKRERAVGAYE
ncbi:hypothetical protein GWI33_015050 [Rhynchophorus ferrugineus]|uniref:Uncharacterized protein n=1 Tax=Rhynchophorus ferrugineus TaxID=354439 RepID=A0A834M6C1_RHYFE|nr:hypothetical protein GWI33_015050 [Rhynchophorus ferrugineus]